MAMNRTNEDLSTILNSNPEIQILKPKELINLDIDLRVLNEKTLNFIEHINSNNLSYFGDPQIIRYIIENLTEFDTNLKILNERIIKLLFEWKIRQQELSVGGSSTKDIFYKELLKKLDDLDKCFDIYYEIILKMKNFVSFIVQKIATNGPQNGHIQFIDLCSNFRKRLECMTKEMLKESIVISKQPASIVTMFQERREKGQRKSRFWFDLELRLLGATVLNHYGTINSQNKIANSLEVILLTDPNSAKDEFCERNGTTQMKYEVDFEDQNNENDNFYTTGRMVLRDIRIQKITRRPKGVKERRYSIKWDLNLNVFGVNIKITKLTLPFALVIEGHPGLEIEVPLFMERSFASEIIAQLHVAGNGFIDNGYTQLDIYAELNGGMLEWKHRLCTKERILEALELKFQAICEKATQNESQKSHQLMRKDSNSSESSSTTSNGKHPLRYQQRFFSQNDKIHIWNILNEMESKHLKIRKFLELCSCSKCSLKKMRIQSNQDEGVAALDVLYKHIVALKLEDGEKSCSFLEWFFKVAEMTSSLLDSWNKFRIYGFCSQQDSINILSSSNTPKMLIRFADTIKSQFRISMNDHKGIRHETLTFVNEQLHDEAGSLFVSEPEFWIRIKMLANKFHVYTVYPNTIIISDESRKLSEHEYGRTYNTTPHLVDNISKIFQNVL